MGAAHAAETQRNASHPVPQGPLPLRVHVFEDYETDIEKRWWLRGAVETNGFSPSYSIFPNRNRCRATKSKDFDDKMGDPTKSFKAVVFNPVPGPPMGPNTRLSFRYWLEGSDTLRVQIYSLSKGYHRFLTLTNLPQRDWESATVDMTAARRPDGSGGSLAEDERIDDIQFYVAPEAELLIDDIVLYEAAPPGETDPFPGRVIFTGWFDTGKQGAGNEWPGDFEIVKHDAPLTWKAARSVVNRQTGQPWIRVQLRGARPLLPRNCLRFRYHLTSGDSIKLVLANSRTGQEWNAQARVWVPGKWAEATVDFLVTGSPGVNADELRFFAPNNAELLVDDLLLFYPAPSDSIASLQSDALRVVVVDNVAFGATHRAGYNGVAELLLAAPGAKNLFVPSVAGLNFEHIFSGDALSFEWSIFEPRRAPMKLVRRSVTRVDLLQEGTEHWPLRSRLTYEITNDAIDFTYCGTPLVDAWRKHGYIGVFFASYIDKPEDMSLQFIGRSRPGRGEAGPRWIKHLPPKHGEAANHRPAGSSWDPPLDEGFNIPLAKGTSDFEYVYPFYFGRSGENVFIMMFERPRDGGELRFAQSPSGGGTGNPAWDFVYFQRRYEVNREFCFRARAVFRKFKDAEEVIRVYEQWSGQKVSRPDNGRSDTKP